MFCVRSGWNFSFPPYMSDPLATTVSHNQTSSVENLFASTLSCLSFDFNFEQLFAPENECLKVFKRKTSSISDKFLQHFFFFALTRSLAHSFHVVLGFAISFTLLLRQCLIFPWPETFCLSIQPRLTHTAEADDGVAFGLEYIIKVSFMLFGEKAKTQR